MTMPRGARGRSWLAGLFTVALLAACGGGDDPVPGQGGPSGAPTSPGAFTSMIVFGDSLSDGGTYTVATSLTQNGQPPFVGGRFTTNLDNNASPVWAERLASQIGLTLTPAEAGFGSTSVPCPIAATVPALASTCTNYAQGGARVTNPEGIGKSSGFLTFPVSTQIANHLDRVGNFQATDLVAVWAGSNDVLLQATALATANATISADLNAGRITATEASRRQFEALQAEQAKAKAVALQLASLVKSQIVGKGARYVVVVNLPDIGQTPRVAALGSSTAAAVSSLVETYNLWLRTGLDDVPVQLFDMYAFFRGVIASPANYGLTNVTGVACNLALVNDTSLFCNGTAGAPYNTLVSGASVDTWLFADSIHPSTAGHREIAEEMLTSLGRYGWLAPD